VQVAAPAAAKLPAAQATHAEAAEAPTVAEAEPAGQGCGAEAAGQNQPAGHATEFCVAPGGHMTPAWHAMHWPDDVAPGCEEKVPVAHCVGGAPDPEQYWPAGHGMLLAVEPVGQ